MSIEAPGLDKDKKAVAAERDFWVPENLLDFFKEEEKELIKKDDALKAIEGDASLSAEGKEKKAAEVMQRYPVGPFLLELWSAMDLGLRSGGKLDAEAGKELRDFYLEAGRSHPKLGDKALLANRMKSFALAHGMAAVYSPDAIRDLAEENDELALEELQGIKSAAPTSKFANRLEEGFAKTLDLNKFPPHTARAVLEDMRILEERKFKDENPREPEGDEEEADPRGHITL